MNLEPALRGRMRFKMEKTDARTFNLRQAVGLREKVLRECFWGDDKLSPDDVLKLMES